jgi:hypothetical protein
LRHTARQELSIVGTEQVRPSSWYYLLAVLFFAAGIAFTAYFFFVDIRTIRASMERMDLPGHMDLELNHRETYTVFAEYPNLQSGPVSAHQARGLLVNCQVHALPYGEPVSAKDTTGASTYSYGTRKGVSLLEFQVPKDGTYSLECQGPSEISGQQVQVAIGGGASKALSAVIGRSFLVLTGGIVIGALIFMRVAMLRLASRKEIRERGLRPI